MRTPLNAEAIATVTQVIEASAGQRFYETPKAIELWQEEPLRRLKRWPRKRIAWIFPEAAAGQQPEG